MSDNSSTNWMIAAGALLTGLGALGYKYMMYDRPHNLEIKKSENFAMLQQDLISTMYNDYNSQLEEMTQTKDFQQAIGNKSFRKARELYMNDSPPLPQHIKDAITQHGGLKKYLMEYVKTKVAAMMLVIDKSILETAKIYAESLDMEELQGSGYMTTDYLKQLKANTVRLESLDQSSPEYIELVKIIEEQLSSEFHEKMLQIM